MTATLTQSPPKRGDALHFRKTLENIVRVRPRYPIDTWTDADAAEFYLPGYDYGKANPITPGLILAVVARLVAKTLYTHAKFHPFITRYRTHTPHIGVNTVYPTNSLLRVFYLAYQTSPDNLSNEGVYFSYQPNSIDGTMRLQPKRQSYCHRSTCKHTNSFLQGCIPAHNYNTMKDHGQIVPWSSVNWGGLACWLSPMRHSGESPYIAIRRERSHLKEAAITRDMANAIREFHDLMPRHLLGIATSGWFATELRPHIEALEGERLRYYGMVVHKPNCDQLMQRWDDTFTAHCWMFGAYDKVYANTSDSYWDLEWEKFSAIAENQMDNLFPVIPMPETPDA